jgi:hypothetical protein
MGFFRGCIPPMWGSTVYRSIMMSSYEATYTYFDKVSGVSSRAVALTTHRTNHRTSYYYIHPLIYKEP